MHALTPGWTPPPPPAPSVIAVGSGKGGVGKSMVALNLAVALSAAGDRVGLLDADVHAPDIPLMLGLARRAPARQWVLSRAGGFQRTPLEPVGHGWDREHEWPGLPWLSTRSLSRRPSRAPVD